MNDKLVLVAWDGGDDRVRRREVLLGEVAPALLAAGVTRLGVDVADEHADVRGPSPFPLRGERPCALVNAWLPGPGLADEVVETVRRAGLRVAAYRVEESVPTDYGDNPHAPPRSWPDGQRSPGLLTVNLLERPRRLTREAWVARWHGRMTPVSVRIQPRTRYVRNLVVEVLTPGAPPWEGIVEEGWPTPDTVGDPWRFYGARTPGELVRHQLQILGAVSSFLTPWRVLSVPMSEYLVRT